jgi:hypothetical protein
MEQRAEQHQWHLRDACKEDEQMVVSLLLVIVFGLVLLLTPRKLTLAREAVEQPVKRKVLFYRSAEMKQNKPVGEDDQIKKKISGM